MISLRYLIIRLSAIGDVLHCTPVARVLKQRQPNCHITWLVGKTAAELLTYNQYIDEIIVWPREDFDNHIYQGRYFAALKMLHELRKQLITQQYDIILDVHGLFLTGLIAQLSQVPARIGLRGTKEFNSLFMTELAPLSKTDHVIERYVNILQRLNISPSPDLSMTLNYSQAEQQFAEELFIDNNISKNDKIIAIHPVTSWESKNWPPRYYSEVINKLGKSFKFIICGGLGDRKAAESIQNEVIATIINITGATSLLQLAAVLKKCTVVIAGDTGPLHMAIAMNVPTVSMFGPTDGRNIGPVKPGHIILQSNNICSLCYKKTCRHQEVQCMQNIMPGDVIKAIFKLL